MIITESFVWINFPKTASTFVRECLRELYTIPWWNLAKRKRFDGRWMREMEMPLIYAPDIARFGKPTPHGVVRQIPQEYIHLKMLSSVRDPVERLVSLYHYADWKKTDALNDSIDNLRARYPKFPDLKFDEFYDLFCQKQKRFIVNKKSYLLGGQSYSLLNFFCNFQNIHNNQEIIFQSWGELAEIFNQVVFISSKNFSRQLFENILKFGYSQKDLNFILDKEMVNISKRNSEVIINNSLTQKIYASEWLLDMINNGSGQILEEEFRSRAVEVG